jgi:hypothetical protein
MANYTKATNFLAKDSLATGDAAKIIKGSEFDTEFNALQTAVNSKANSISPAFTGTPTAPTAGSGTNTTQLATTEFVTVAVTASFPSGGIIIWSGSVAAIPTGWLLCNGSSSTPDLRNRFVVGAGSTYAVGATGGSADAVVVSHTHTATVTDPGHAHTAQSQATGGQYASGGFSLTFGSGNTSSATTGITVANSTTGVSGTNANLPPYYALCYIMKS